MNPGIGHVRVLTAAVLVALLAASQADAAERELDAEPAPASAGDIETPIERVFPEDEPGRVLLRNVREKLSGLPAFFADTELHAEYRSYYLYKDRVVPQKSEAWAMGGSLGYRSGWLAESLQLELEAFTSQPVDADDDRDGTLLLAPGQDGYTVLGIANAKLQRNGLVLTGFRQYLDLPYVNRQDSRMTPNTFESVTLAKPEGEFRFSTGYTWKIKRRNSDDFVSMSEALGLDGNTGLVHAGAVWEPSNRFHMGAVLGAMNDVFTGLYAELGVNQPMRGGLAGRLDLQFTGQQDWGQDELGDLAEDTWNVGLRGALSGGGAVLRLGGSVTSKEGPIAAFFGTNPTYVDLMQRTFNRADEKALLVSASYDFTRVGAPGLSAIMNFVAAFEGESPTGDGDAQEVDFTLDYRLARGRLEGLWLRLRGSWLGVDDADDDGYDARFIVRYDLPVL